MNEALALVEREGPFDAVLTDLRMPEASGLDLLAEVRERDPEALVLVLTAFGDAAGAAEAIRAGAYDFISKPYDLAELRGPPWPAPWSDASRWPSGESVGVPRPSGATPAVAAAWWATVRPSSR